jgi:hypothetical protein
LSGLCDQCLIRSESAKKASQISEDEPAVGTMDSATEAHLRDIGFPDARLPPYVATKLDEMRHASSAEGTDDSIVITRIISFCFLRIE